mmetsp:Transcript_11328/g.24581  ORF Transcript_11328/g.24581 Transcript_11328/m.24581 type:complete len:293 (+) Transcript_11328:2677-3555(+)
MRGIGELRGVVHAPVPAVVRVVRGAAIATREAIRAHCLGTLATRTGGRGRQRLQSSPTAIGHGIIVVAIVVVLPMVNIERWVGNGTMHDPKGIFPQRFRGTLREENVDAWLALTIVGDGGAWPRSSSVGASPRGAGGSTMEGGPSSGGGATVSHFLLLVNTAVVEDVLERIVFGVAVVGDRFNCGGGMSVVIGVVPIIVIRKPCRGRSHRRSARKAGPRTIVGSHGSAGSAIPLLALSPASSATATAIVDVSSRHIHARQRLAEGADNVVLVVIHHGSSSSVFNVVMRCGSR